MAKIFCITVCPVCGGKVNKIRENWIGEYQGQKYIAFDQLTSYISLNHKKWLFREMKFAEFKNLVKDIPAFSVPQLALMAKDKQTFLNQISQWKKRGLIIPLKKGLYILNEHDRKLKLSREYIANQLVFPSYVSLEYALSFYGFIPERAFHVTSITSKKTTEFVNSYGTFIYRNLKNELFFGYLNLQDEYGVQILMAEKEKAFLDFLYLNLSQVNPDNPDFLEASYRFENLDELNQSKILNYSEKFQSKKLIRLIQTLIS